MRKKLFVVECEKCLKTFRTPNEDKHICSSCLKLLEKAKKQKERLKKRKGLSIEDICYIETVYNKVHDCYKTYGDIVNIIENTDKDLCVCCGGKSEQPICEKCEEIAKTRG